MVFLLSQHKVAEANRVSRDRKGNDTNMREREMNTDTLRASPGNMLNKYCAYYNLLSEDKEG